MSVSANSMIECLVNTDSRLIRRIDARIVPASMLIYLLCFLDRSNIASHSHTLINAETNNVYCDLGKC